MCEHVCMWDLWEILAWISFNIGIKKSRYLFLGISFITGP
nr:MAG TPA: hypothetical protein [Caudoviricetes sp.]